MEEKRQGHFECSSWWHFDLSHWLCIVKPCWAKQSCDLTWYWSSPFHVSMHGGYLSKSVMYTCILKGEHPQTDGHQSGGTLHMELWGHGQSQRGSGPGFHPQEKEAVQDEQPRRDGRADKEWEQRRSEITAQQPDAGSPRGRLTEISVSFSVSVEALEPHDVSERPRHGRRHRGRDGRPEPLQGLAVEAGVRSVEGVVTERRLEHPSVHSFKHFHFPDNDFWFPMDSSASGPVPPCARGHSATYDPDSKSVYVYGGLREGQRYSELYILSTLTWNWKLVTVGLWRVSDLLWLQILIQGWGRHRFVCVDSRRGEIFQIWRIILQPFIRASCLCLAAFTHRAVRPERNPAVMLCTSSTQSMSSGTSRSWRGTSLSLGLGQSF